MSDHTYIDTEGVWSPAGVGAIKSLKTSKPLKQGVRIVDIFKPLTVNWLLGRLVNTLADKANGAESRR